MNKIKISVILPVYNVAPYIGKCILALKAQTLTDLEFIFVDDCSDDGSAAIIEEFAREDDRVRLLKNAENLGPGVSRNAGIESAKGDYLSFVDPDDWIEADFYEILYKKAIESGAPIVIGKVIRIDDATGQAIPGPTNMISRIQEKLASGCPLYCTSLYGHFSMLFAADLFRDKAVRFGSTRNGEDTTFLLRASLKTNSIAAAEAAVYYYRENRNNSASSTLSKKKLLNELDAFQEKVESLYEPGPKAVVPDKWRTYYLARRIHACVMTYSDYAEANHADRDEDIAFCKKLTSCVRHIPEYPLLRLSSPEAHILFDYCYPIPIWIDVWSANNSLFNYRWILRWTDFLTEHPEARQFFADDYVEVVYTAVTDCREKTRTLEKESAGKPDAFRYDEKYAGFLRGQLLRFDTGFRLKLYAKLFTTYTKKYVTRLLKQARKHLHLH